MRGERYRSAPHRSILCKRYRRRAREPISHGSHVRWSEVSNQSAPIVHSQFPICITCVKGHCIDADAQLECNFLQVHSVRKKLTDFRFTRGKRTLGQRRAVLGFGLRSSRACRDNVHVGGIKHTFTGCVNFTTGRHTVISDMGRLS
jgi:hypothetical protein